MRDGRPGRDRLLAIPGTASRPVDRATPATDPAPAIADLLQGVGLLLGLVVAAASVAAVIVRFRRSVGAEHQQIKWFASAAAVEFAAIFVMSAPGSCSRRRSTPSLRSSSRR